MLSPARRDWMCVLPNMFCVCIFVFLFDVCLKVARLHCFPRPTVRKLCKCSLLLTFLNILQLFWCLFLKAVHMTSEKRAKAKRIVNHDFLRLFLLICVQLLLLPLFSIWRRQHIQIRSLLCLFQSCHLLCFFGTLVKLYSPPWVVKIFRNKYVCCREADRAIGISQL
jgi:hypothetical protein